METSSKSIGSGLRLSLEIGMRVMVQFGGQEKPMKALFIGMEPGTVLILRLSGVEGSMQLLYEGNTATVKFVSSGMVYGFQTTCQGVFLRRNLILAVMSYPDAVRTYDQRSEARLDSCLPATLIAREDGFPGYLLDLSPSGCGFVLAQTPERPVPEMKVGNRVTVSMHLPDAETTQVLPCRIENVRNEEQSVVLGLHFDLASESKFSLNLFRRFLAERSAD